MAGSKIHRIDPPIWLYVPDRKEAGLAHFLINRGPEMSAYWVVFMDCGVILELENEKVRAHRNGTLGRGADLSKVGLAEPPRRPA